MSETNMTKRPEVIQSRKDAVQLWKHLLTRGIPFHWQDDPAEWVGDDGGQILATTEVKSVRRLFAEVERLDEPGCYDDAVSLLKLATLVGTDSVSRVPGHHASAFERCGSPVEAIWVLEHLH